MLPVLKDLTVQQDNDKENAKPETSGDFILLHVGPKAVTKFKYCLSLGCHNKIPLYKK